MKASQIALLFFLLTVMLSACDEPANNNDDSIILPDEYTDVTRTIAEALNKETLDFTKEELATVTHLKVKEMWPGRVDNYV